MEGGQGGSAEGGGLRASMRMLAALAKQPAWVDSMTPDVRGKVARMLEGAMANAESPRDASAICKAWTSLERNDIERTKLFLEAEKVSEEDAASTAEFREIAEQVFQRRPKPPEAKESDAPPG